MTFLAKQWSYFLLFPNFGGFWRSWRLTPLDRAKFFSKNSLKIIQKYSIEIQIEWCVNHASNCNSFGKKCVYSPRYLNLKAFTHNTL